MKNFFAAIRIGAGNFWHDFGAIICWALVLLFLAAMVWMLWRAVRCRVPFSGRYRFDEPDEALTRHAAESLSQAVRFETVDGNAEELKRLTKYLKERYPLCFTRMTVDEIGGGSLLLRWTGQKTGRQPVLFAAHMDVSPAEGDWREPPFSGTQLDGKLWGRGSVDCKNVLVALLECAERMLESDFKPKRDLYFAFSHDGKTGGTEGTAAMVRTLQKQGVRLAMMLNEGGCIENGFMGAPHAAAARVGVAEKGMCNVRLTVQKDEGHASVPARRTAAGILAEAVERIELSPLPARFLPLTKEYFKKSAGCMPFGMRFLCANFPVTQRRAVRRLLKSPETAAMLHTTAVPTMLEGASSAEVLPRTASAVLNVRVLPGETCREAAEQLAVLISDLPCEAEMLPGGYDPGEQSDYSGEMFDILSKTIAERFGAIPVLPELTCEATDGRHYEALCGCVYRFMPFVLSGQQLFRRYGEEERLPIASLGAAVEFYEALIRRMA